MTIPLRTHTFLGITQSLCPECLRLVPAKIISKGQRVYFRKRCPDHGVREDFVCSDVALYDQMELSVPGKTPKFGVEPDKGCPYDCGLCTEHEQHTCVGLVEITSNCNLKCPMCFASSGPGGEHWSFAEAKAAIDRLVEVEGRAEVLQISGGEPTIHPEFSRILDYACAQPIDIVMINTNGVRLAHDGALLDCIAEHRGRAEVYLQFDGFSERSSEALRGESLVATKLKAIANLGERGIKTTLVVTLQPGVNDHEIGDIVKFGVERPWITGLSLQPATYSGRHVLPADIENRITFPDVIKAIADQTGGVFREDDFLPLPCAHPNCHSLTYAFRSAGSIVPLTRFIDARNHLDILANGILFTRNRAKQLIQRYLANTAGCGASCSGATDAETTSAAESFFAKALAEDLSQADVFRITITSFLDAYNFDVRRLMKCCIHHVLPSGHVIPFCAYNVLYREGHAVLPALRDAGVMNEVVTIGTGGIDS
jgi:7,8-dihydro-6-hydroxymethylpterin dimethyltransferase